MQRFNKKINYIYIIPDLNSIYPLYPPCQNTPALPLIVHNNLFLTSITVNNSSSTNISGLKIKVERHI